MKHYFLLIFLIFGLYKESFGTNKVIAYESVNGRISADSKLHQSVKQQYFDLNALNLKNKSINSLSVAQNSNAISITLTDFNDFSDVGKTWLWYQNYEESFSMNIGSANNT
nr:hypothetical protein [Spirosomataceae bacterium]